MNHHPKIERLIALLKERTESHALIWERRGVKSYRIGLTRGSIFVEGNKVEVYDRHGRLRGDFSDPAICKCIEEAHARRADDLLDQLIEDVSKVAAL